MADINKVIVKKQWFIKSQTGKVDDFYQAASKKTLGQGTYGSVIKVKLKNSNQQRAIKIIPKSRVKNPQRFLNEINIMRNLDHPNIIKLYETFEDARNVYLVMELCDGGELFDRIIAKGHYTEQEARVTFTQIVQAVNHCHSNGICHRDLKPENFLLLNKSDDSPIKVIDFGLSYIFQENDLKIGGGPITGEKLSMSTRAGTPYYISPEVLEGKYDEGCDIWSLGVILFILLSGVPPFYGPNDSAILEMVKSRKFSFEIPEFNNVSESAKDLIRKCLTTPDKRLTASQILQHPWTQETGGNKSNLKLNFNALKNFTSHEKIKKVALTYIASQLSESEIIELGKLFKQLDKNNDGVLTIEEITAGLNKLDSKQSKEIESIISSMDTDGSGTINYTEFIAASMDKSIYMKEEKLLHAFKMLDLDGSGKISKDELKSVLGTDEQYKDLNDEYWENMIKEADKNGDGEIDYSEFVEMMNKTK
ncbi:hypothetical protein ABPG72_003966 [Tetrahymena utriculariae]